MYGCGCGCGYGYECGYGCGYVCGYGYGYGSGCRLIDTAAGYIDTLCPVGNRFRIHQARPQGQGQWQWQGQGQEQGKMENNGRRGFSGGDGGISTYNTNNTSNTNIPCPRPIYSWLGPQSLMPPSPAYQLPGPDSLGLGMQYVQLDCNHNTAERICEFYRVVLGSQNY
ncbi:hypothetical protein B484DRAFT_447088 [Ochromonadaceae sp. CCMP2298]|nr:hypothetical protein B484DRAFT_447088 [Ochromonadaceae sp. CCMP2298]